MKKMIFTLFSLAMINSTLLGQAVNVMSYNIRYANESDGINKWDERKESLIDLLKTYKPDFLGIQEGLYHQVQYIDSALDIYDFIGIGRDDGKNKGEFSAVFFNKNRYSVLTDSTIWLSENPESVSVGWDASMERICTFGLFEEKNTGNINWIFNTHYDHISAVARENSSKLIIKTIKDLTWNLPVILTGDFNSLPESRPISIINEYLNDAYSLSNLELGGPEGTFTGFKKDAKLKKRIDYIFVKGFDVLSLSHLDNMRKDGYFISDHLPVVAELKISK